MQTRPWPVSTCSAPLCRAQIYWAVTEGGKAMPVDVDPSPRGTLMLEDRGDERPLAVGIPRAKRGAREDLHTSHFATCKRANVFRR